MSCDGAPSGYVNQSGDCNDSSALYHPGADEVCGGGDRDCDGISYPSTADDGYEPNESMSAADSLSTGTYQLELCSDGVFPPFSSYDTVVDWLRRPSVSSNSMTVAVHNMDASTTLRLSCYHLSGASGMGFAIQAGDSVSFVFDSADNSSNRYFELWAIIPDYCYCLSYEIEIVQLPY